MHRTSALRRLPLAMLVALSMAGSAGCSPLGYGASPAGLDPRISQSSYIEDGNLVALVVGTRPTRQRVDRDYIPLEVAVVNKGLPSLTLTRESFTLVDEEGNRYGTVGRDELVRGYGNVDVDRRLGEVGPVVRGHFQAYQQVRGTLTASFDRPVEQKVFLPRYTFVVDFIYFPRPVTGVLGHKFELFLETPELSEPVFVRFEVAR